jgi:NDP-sugar pyrophosphorylase family protein
MHALVLTAGLGTRLDPLTRLVAKPAVPLGDRTLVEHVIAWLQRQTITDLVLNLHHRPSTITAIVGDGRHLGVRVRYSWEQPLLGSAGGPRRALPLLDSDPFLIVNGDTLCDFDLAPLLAAHAMSGADVTMAVVPNPRPEHYNGIAVDAEGRVTGFVARQVRRSTSSRRPEPVEGRSSKFEARNAVASFHFVGVQVAQARVFAGLRDGEPAETVAGLYREMVAARPGAIRVWPAPTSFLDVGTPRDYLRAAMSLQDAPAGRGANVVWAGAVVDAGAQIANCIVAGDLRLAAGFSARDAVIVPAAIARPDDAVERRNGVAVFPMGP